MRTILDLYKNLSAGASLLPTNTGFDWWEAVYTANATALDREFARRYTSFKYFDFLETKDTTLAESIADLKADVLSILTFNQKRYAEMYRVFCITDEDMPITYNYDMTETTGAQHEEYKYGQHETEYGATSETKGAQENTYGAQSDTHMVAPFNSAASVEESKDESAQYINTDGSRTDTTLAHTDTDKEHTDETDRNAWTLTRQGNIGTQTGADIARIFTTYWTEHYKFMMLIFDDIAKQLLLIGEC